MRRARKHRRWDGRPSRFVRRLAVESHVVSEIYRDAAPPLKAVVWCLALLVIAALTTAFRLLGVGLPEDPLDWLLRRIPP